MGGQGYNCRRHGFALTELVVVIGIIGILLAIAVPAYNGWQRKHAIEKEAFEIHSEISGLRFQAIATKMEHRAIFNQRQYTFKRYTSSADDGNSATSTIKTATVPYDIQSGAFGTNASNLIINFNPMGVVSGAMATLVFGTSDSNANFNCLVVSRARENLGKMNGTTCEFK